jgi:hypothetical protein
MLKVLPRGDPGDILPLNLLHWFHINTLENGTIASNLPPRVLRAETHSNPAGGKPWLLTDLAVGMKQRLLNVVAIHLSEDARGEKPHRSTPDGIMDSARDIM